MAIVLQDGQLCTDVHESDQALPWKVSDAPQEFTEKLLQAIVGIEIPIATLVGKWKVSQNRPVPDKLGVVAGLIARDDTQSKEMASLVSQHVSIPKGG
jgi:transcriptional regulator